MVMEIEMEMEMERERERESGMDGPVALSDQSWVWREGGQEGAGQREGGGGCGERWGEGSRGGGGMRQDRWVRL